MNRKLRRILTLAAALMAFIAFEVFIQSCASRSAPSGGPRDTTAPVLDTSFPPNYSTHFNAREIRLVFNEYINLKSGQQQLMISPPLKEKPEIESGSREVVVKLNDSLRANTTYIVSFGNSITDFTEGNENTDIRYVFSTGSYIDSLRLSGLVRSAFTGAPAEGIMVGLYDQSQVEEQDSFLYKQLPNYYAYADEDGRFELTNLKEGQYRLIAFDDKQDDFLLNTGSEIMAFWPEPVHLRPDTVLNYELKAFAPIADFRFYRARHNQRGQLKFAFSKKPDSLSIKPLNQPEDSAFFLPNPAGDTLNYWFQFERDSLSFLLNGEGFTDSVYSVSLREYQVPNLRLTTKSIEIRPVDTIFFNSKLPLTGFNSDSIFRMDKDTTNLQLYVEDDNPLRAFLPPPHRHDFSLRIDPGGVQSWFDPEMDTARYKFTVLRGEDLGTLHLKVKTDTVFQYILRLYNDKEKQIKEVVFEDSTSVSLKNRLPGVYKAYIIQDVNRDRKWTTGNLKENRLPEIRLEFMDKMEIRANWEVDMTWQVRPD